MFVLIDVIVDGFSETGQLTGLGCAVPFGLAVVGPDVWDGIVDWDAKIRPHKIRKVQGQGVQNAVPAADCGEPDGIVVFAYERAGEFGFNPKIVGQPCVTRPADVSCLEKSIRPIKQISQMFLKLIHVLASLIGNPYPLACRERHRVPCRPS